MASGRNQGGPREYKEEITGLMLDRLVLCITAEIQTENVTELSLQKRQLPDDHPVLRNNMRNKKFVGPDGKTYLEHKPEEGSFLTYFDGSTWLITFPLGKELDRSYYFYGNRLPATARDWKIQHIGNRGNFPACFECG